MTSACTSLALIASFAGCYYGSAPDVSGGGGVDGQVASTEFPCEVANVLTTCWGCHSNPPRGGAPIPLTKLADLRAVSGVAPAMSVAERAVIRMKDSARPMPPPGSPRPAPGGIDAFTAWVASGMPPGSCDGVTPPGDGGPTGPFPTVCSSGQKYIPQNGDDDDEDGSPDMNPGMPCRACHLANEPDEARFFMGTAYPTLHEQDRCFSTVAAGTRVEILDANGNVAVTMPVRARGNFFSMSRNANIALPFTARVVSPSGAFTQMTTPQMTGDCNSCHTEQGANGAPGRILLPPN
ncbi:MAG: hypothetical protein H0T46_13260 [Deltaproteobacteria bacterium]|nr:hypothetical protein [Deltaproteobacteria bacterium]